MKNVMQITKTPKTSLRSLAEHNSRSTLLRIAPLMLCVIAITVGCGRSLESTVQGTVTLDGQPIPRGTVKFYPATKDGRTIAYAAIQPDGTYQIQTGKIQGIAPGDYVITVQATKEQTREQALALVMPESIIPISYNNVKTTNLSETVEPGHNQINLTLN